MPRVKPHSDNGGRTTNGAHWISTGAEPVASVCRLLQKRREPRTGALGRYTSNPFYFLVALVTCASSASACLVRAVVRIRMSGGNTSLPKYALFQSLAGAITVPSRLTPPYTPLARLNVTRSATISDLAPAPTGPAATLAS